MRFFLPGYQLFQPPERVKRTGVAARLMKVYRRRLPLGQSQGRRFCCLFDLSQVHPHGPQINTAEYPATLLQSNPVFFPPLHLYHLIEPHTGEGDEKVR
jgi:hypothetical protein